MKTSMNYTVFSKRKNGLQQKSVSILIILGFMLFIAQPVNAHCDSYDGPVIQDAKAALENNQVDRVLKWINEDQEEEIIALFQKTYDLKNGDPEIYAIVKKHFLETLVRLHRETEGAPYTGLKPAGSAAPIIQKADLSIENNSVDQLKTALSKHVGHVVDQKFQRVAEFNKVKDHSVAEGREYVEAYVDYTHTLEAIKEALEHGMGKHSAH